MTEVVDVIEPAPSPGRCRQGLEGMEKVQKAVTGVCSLRNTGLCKLVDELERNHWKSLLEPVDLVLRDASYSV